ncbi:type VI secretion system transmembrane protein TssQ [Bacteroides fragilis]|mgnify:FL=1|uniref:type VI secretion system TssO n=1 Tax=Bacteroides fragilis TaxID=817 RepID=UPI00202EA82B|nr:type VI secretion system TssO [Bacteroides fragilis]MCM0301898.1 type VI secretion system transmembrane protein TssQ [Bacteroides fragilis]
MKAKNSEKIIHGYLKFAGDLFISTALSMTLLTGFIHTNSSEYKLMKSKTEEYDKIYAGQIALVDKVDSLYNYLSLMGSNEQLNQIMLQKVVSTRKMELIEELQRMDTKDVLIYNNLASQINVFLETKEAIRKAVIEESLVRDDLMRCVQDNKQAARKLTLGNISVEK